MKILGIHDGHTATAALSENGTIKAAISEERINRIKEWQGLPKKAIKKVMQITNTSPEEIDLVVFSNIAKPINWDQYAGKKPSINVIGFDFIRTIFPKTIMKSNLWINPSIKIASFFRGKKEIFSFFEKMRISRKKIIFADHHTCHAYSTLSNPWAQDDDALVITLDGSGDGYCSTVNILDKGTIKNIEKTSIYNSLGFLYGKATQFLNMKPASHEYKVMGLAAYAKEEHYSDIYKKLIKKYIRINSKNKLRFENISGCATNDYIKKLKKDFGKERFDNFAGGLQRFTEELILKFIKNCIKKTGKRTIFLSGGVFMNVKANMRIMYEAGIEKLFIFPSCSDESNSIGACNYGYFLLCKKNGKKPKYSKLKNNYLGEKYSNEEIKRELENHKDKLQFSFVRDIDSHVAKKLAKGNIVARFSGKMEFGARALGNRSILANPSSKDAIREINDAIKMRDFWMPFAGTILSEDKDKYLISSPKIDVDASYMILAFKMKEKGKEEIISAAHQYDLTCRPQILEKEINPNYYTLIKKFKKLTGIGAVLNTSFNIHGYPIVCSPKDAIKTLLGSGLKYLAIGNYYVEKRNL